MYYAPFRTCAYHETPIHISAVVYDITRAQCTSCKGTKLKAKPLHCPKCHTELETTYTADGFIAQCKGDGSAEAFTCPVYMIEHHNGNITLSTTKAKGSGPYAKETL